MQAIPGAAADAAHTVGEKVTEAAHAVAEKAAEVVNAVVETVTDIGASAAASAQEAVHR